MSGELDQFAIFKGLPHSLRFPRNAVSRPAWQSLKAPVLAHTVLGMRRCWGESLRHLTAASRRTGLGSTQCPGWRAQCRREKEEGKLRIPRELFFTQCKGLRFTSTVGCYKLSRFGHACSKIKNTITKCITIAVIFSPI